MKKLPLILGVVMVIIAVFVFVNKLYYPPLPITGVSPKEAMDAFNESNSKIVQIAEEGGSLWYITKTENNGIETTDAHIKQLIAAEGWEFKEKEGSGLFFEKNGERLIATTQMWTKNYVIVNIPEFNSSTKE
ncbi:hypothetical protein [Lysinibacillus sp. SGAir0095]|uniref:hypothetical protein n=1 Tax=Lysinibacillus sp. SGAir0095 TaxID=2070463 RepID=UPI0010CD5BBD|nr:hypothetical protein [Lysinibacillus sp. SGAir0095]QCR31187.1 hypothetical protein C1N55_03000 [Lysinibacillus sp. SGAir0095]